MQSQFDHQKFPPAPVLEIRLSAPREAERTDPLTALVDTGSDFTIVPLEHLLRVNAPESRSAQVRGLWGEAHSVTMYLVDLSFGNLTLPGIEVIGDNQETETILGRNVLNRLILLLDGNLLQTDILARRPLRL